MKLNFTFLFFLSVLTVTANAQNAPSPSLNIGDPAPPLRVREWIKGPPVQRFKKGHVYVVEFWATWCKPCIAAIPHLSGLAAKYKDKVRILGIDIYENKSTSPAKVKAFVDSMGHRMDYQVAIGDSSFMAACWLDASEEQQGIPKSFVVNSEGRLAWIGHPSKLDEILPQIVDNTWNITKALDTRNLNKYLEALDDSIGYEMMRYRGNYFKEGDLGKPDSALLAINEIVKNEPRLKYAPHIAFNTFSSLLKTDPDKAYEYGKVAIVTPTYEEPPYDLIISPIMSHSDKLNLPSKIYLLGAEAYRVKINQIVYPELINVAKLYHKMAEWYWTAGEKSKAIEAGKKAIETLKNKKGFSATTLAEYEIRLQHYMK